jgi:polyisoprenoid-binding protein YceI
MSATTIPTTTPLTGTWAIDPAHSRVEFQVRHLGIATVRGAFRDFQGTLELADSFEESSAYGTVAAGSVDTNEPQRDEHLRSGDFFDAEQHPELSFRSSSIRRIDDETLEIAGGLTMRGVTKPITLTAEILGYEQDPWGNDRVGLDVNGQISRGEWGMTFNQALGSGNMLVSDKVKLHLDISAVKQA